MLDLKGRGRFPEDDRVVYGLIRRASRIDVWGFSESSHEKRLSSYDKCVVQRGKRQYALKW